MPHLLGDTLEFKLQGLDPDLPDYAPRCVEAVLAAAREAGATDVHLQPTGAALELKFRVDGVLLPPAALPAGVAGNVIARLKVLAGLLTYHTDRPQEGRIRLTQDEVEMRVCTYPTLHGERAVVRLFAGAGRYRHLDDLGLPDDAIGPLQKLLGETSGAILVSGPAGSGKTTTVYACLREIARRAAGARSLVSIEDPVEVAVDGVAQSQVHQPSGLDLAAGLRFLMRQDPEVIMVGEIRDRTTAEEALRASLTGHLVLSTFHAGSAAETIGRLSDMGIEPYVLRSGVLAILNQRLLRRLCTCAEPSERPEDRLGLDVRRAMVPRGCAECGQTGYRGRFLLAEMLALSRSELARAVLNRCDTPTIERLAAEAGMSGRWSRACQAVDRGLTSPAEVRRVLGFST
ncbi:MAG: GspE/PulE family protein [Planctomycetes bacterium]|nr:GspE/PulE family protein [Planctomycetota bacterium]MBU4399593.1 GspE/PulE family protein [Planctomycetota bacterium]